MKKPARPVSLELRASHKKDIAGNIVEIKWADGSTSASTAFFLRMKCPCATCREKKPSGVAPHISVTAYGWVGNYAVQLFFSDNHDTGIFTYSYLKELDESTGGG